MLDKLQSISRWMRGTCLDCPPQIIENSSEIYQFSFYEDIVVTKVVTDAMHEFQAALQNLTVTTRNYLKTYDYNYKLN